MASPMEDYLDLVTEYQKAKAASVVIRSTRVERTPEMIAQEAEDALLEVVRLGLGRSK